MTGVDTRRTGSVARREEFGSARGAELGTTGQPGPGTRSRSARCTE
ncbi:hypothetical protein ACIBLA_04590 [Streptomyces sp. NPDC050433]